MVESAFTFNSLFRHCAKWMLTRSKCFQPGEGPSRGLFRDCEIFADGSFAALLKKNLHSYSLGEITRPSPPGVRGQIMCKALDLQTKILWIYSFHIPSGLELAQVTDYDYSSPISSSVSWVQEMVEDIPSVVYLQWLPRLTQLDSSGGGTVTVHTAIYLVMDSTFQHCNSCSANKHFP